MFELIYPRGKLLQHFAYEIFHFLEGFPEISKMIYPSDLSITQKTAQKTALVRIIYQLSRKKKRKKLSRFTSDLPFIYILIKNIMM